jgi:L-iditol 2-dehydrogenase/threonine 3-dehydrogenase
MTSPGTIEYRDVDAPGLPKDHEVLLRIQKIGICGSDIHVFHGEHPAVIYPVVQGHEYAAIVEAVGKDVKDVTPGMHVTARPQLVCGKCSPCLRGAYNICQELKVEGFQAPGVAQELFIVSADRVVAVPKEMPWDHAAMIEPVAVAVHSTARPTSLKGKNVVVSGAGTIGNLVAQYAQLRGAKKVVITDISDHRLEIARQCGITGTINVKTQSFSQESKKLFGNEGFQVALEAAGVPASLDLLLQNIEKGGEIVIIGVYAQNPVVNMYFLGEHELKLIGSLMYLHEDYLDAVEAIASKKMQLDPLISAHFPFEGFPEAYQYIGKKKDQAMKIIIDVAS